MSWVTWTMILAGVGLNATAQLLLKVATRPLAQVADFGLQSMRYSALTLGMSMPFWAGMLCYGMSLCVWLAALSRAPVSIAYPMLSIGYIVVAAIAVLWLGESLSYSKILGIALICAGVVLVSRSTS